MDEFTADPCPTCKPNTVCRTPSCGRLKGKRQEPVIQNKQSEPVGVTIAPMMYKFLMGEGSIDGCWFGDRHSTLKGAFWWRSMLRHSAEAHTHPAVAQEPVAEVTAKMILDQEWRIFAYKVGQIMVGTKLYAEPPAVAVNKDLAKAIHYPQCWDVAAYPTLAHAISELATCFQCCECVKNPAVAVNEQMLDVLKFIQRGMERNHIKAKPFLDFSNPNAESLELQHPLTLVNAAIAAAEAAKGGV